VRDPDVVAGGVYADPMRRGLLILLPLVVVGVVAGLSAIGAREGDAAFVFYQEHPRTILPAQFELILQKTQEPLPTGPGTPVSAAKCTPGTSGPKRNPWSCVVTYGSGTKTKYSLEIQPSGNFKGVDPTGTRIVTGCCLTGGNAPSG
jgi:hypothetical protein